MVLTMIAKRLFVALLLVAGVASAQSRHRGGSQPSAAMVSGIVSSVSGNTIHIADGQIAIDASSAKIVAQNGAPATIASVTAGSLVVATIKEGTIAPNAPLPAATIAVSKRADATLTGPVTAVDAAHNTLTVLGKTIQVNAQTSFGGPLFGAHVTSLVDVQPNELVLVQANPSGNALVAVSVLVLTTTIEHPDLIHGTVQNIAADAWVIHQSNGSPDVAVVINAQTMIVGSPKVGDTVDILVRTDSSNRLVAIAILPSIFGGMVPGH
jgi:hypothetical protein